MGSIRENVLTMRLTLPQQKYPSGEAVTAFFEELTRRVQNVPGVTSAAMVSQFPPTGFFSSQVEVEGVAATGTTLPTANTTVASRDYFKTVAIPLVRGRFFGTRGHAGRAAPRHRQPGVRRPSSRGP